MIRPLRQSRNGDRPDHPCTFHANRKRTTVGCEVRHRQRIFLKQVGSHFNSQPVRTAVKARDKIALTPNPLHVVGRCAAERAVEKRLTESPNVDHDAGLPRNRHCAQPRTERPRSFFVEIDEAKFAFLRGNCSQIIFACAHKNLLQQRYELRGAFCYAGSSEASAPPCYFRHQVRSLDRPYCFSGI